MHLKISAVKHRPGGRNDTPSPKPRRSDASESGKNWHLNIYLCAYQKGLQTKTCRQNSVCLAFCYTTTQTNDLESAAIFPILFSLFCSFQRWGEGACHGCLCGCVFLHIMGLCWWAHGCFSGTEGLHCFVLQKRRRWAKGQRQILSSSAVSIGDRISSPLQVTIVFFCPSHLFVLTSTVFLPLTPVLAPMSHVGCGKSMLVDVWFRTGNQVVFCFCLQTLVHPLLLKMKVQGGRIGVQVPGMEKSEGGGAIHLHHHEGDTEMHPQGENQQHVHDICIWNVITP